MQPYCATRPVALFLFAMLLTLPFINKPFHIDDPDYLRIASQIRLHPLDPYGFELTRGGRWFPVGQAHPSPPFFCYLLAGVTAFTGESEPVLHLFMALLMVTGIFGIARLAELMSVPVWPAVILVMASPMLLPGFNVMLDVPMLVFLICGVQQQWLIVNTDREVSPIRKLISGLFIAAAILTKYPALVVVPAMMLYWWRSWGKIPLLWFMGVAFPTVLWFLFCTIMYRPTEALNRAVMLPSWLQLANNGVSILVILGGTCTVSLLAVRLPSYEKQSGVRLTGSFLGALICVVYLARSDHMGMDPGFTVYLLRGLFGAAGGLLVISLFIHCLNYARSLKMGFSDSQESHQTEFLILWCVTGLAFHLLVRHTTVRHSLPVLFPLVFLMLKELRNTPGDQWKIRIACTVTMVISFGLAHADAQSAHAVKESMKQLAHQFKQYDTIYVAGDWEMSYYAEREGLLPVHNRIDYPLDALRSRFRKGAILAIPQYTYQIPTGKLRPYVHSLESQITIQGPGLLGRINPFRTISRGVNYYDVGIRNLPWSVVFTPWESLNVYRLMVQEP